MLAIPTKKAKIIPKKTLLTSEERVWRRLEEINELLAIGNMSEVDTFIAKDRKRHLVSLVKSNHHRALEREVVGLTDKKAEAKARDILLMHNRRFHSMIESSKDLAVNNYH